MTQLKTISNNHLSLQCRCDHSKLVSVKELIGKLSLTTTIYEVARKAKCSHCGAIGVVDFRLHYVFRTKQDFYVPAQNIRNVVRKTVSLLFQQAGKKAQNI